MSNAGATEAEWWPVTKMGVTATGHTSAKAMAMAATSITALVARLGMAAF